MLFLFMKYMTEGSGLCVHCVAAAAEGQNPVQSPAKCGMWQAGADSNTLAEDGTHIVKD